MTREQLAGAGIPGVDAVLVALATVGDQLAGVPDAEVWEGLRRAADPASAVHALARLPGAAAGHVTALLQMLGAGPAVASALLAEGEAWPALLADTLEVAERDVAAHRALLAAAPTGTRADLQRALRIHRRRELARIGGRDVLGLATVEDTVRELSALAEAVIDVAVEKTRARLAADWGGDAEAAFVVLGMGKLGGAELNYSSDVDLVYVYDHDGEHPGGRTYREFFVRLAEETTRVLAEATADGLCFRVDMRLRPGGAEGPLAASSAATVSYYETWGQTWERAVWLKARPVGGDRRLGDGLLGELEPFVYRRFLDFGTIEDLKAMKRRVDASLRSAGERQRNVKLGRGGIRAIEFIVQAQQLVHAGKDRRLRLRATLPALARLAEAGYLPDAEATVLRDAYCFLRDVEHKLQIVRQRQTHTIPDDAEERLALARRLGLLGPDGVAEFECRHAVHTDAVQAAFDDLFHGAEEQRRRDARPELAALVEQANQTEPTRQRLAALGFRDLDGALADVRLLHDGPAFAPASPRRRQALAALAPTLVAEIVGGAAPDRALHHMATFIATVGARTSYLHLLLENPGVLRLLIALFGTSEFLSHFFLRHPELLDSLVRADLVQVTRPRVDMGRELRSRLAAAPDFEARLDTLRRFRNEEFLRVGVHDIQAALTGVEVSAQLTSLAEVCLAEALDIGWQEACTKLRVPQEAPSRGLAVVGMGKLGGGELNYHSDLDILFVYDPGDPAWWPPHIAPHEFFTRVAQRAISALQTPTREGIAYRVDTRLRPSGNKGPLVSSLEGFEAYHHTSAALWERQALVKARGIVGSERLCARLDAAIEGFVYGRGLDAAEVAEMAHMRDRIERERGTDDGAQVNIKTGRGGLVDVEWVVQMLQLRHGHAEPRLRVRSTRAALDRLGETGLLPAEAVAALRDGYEFLRALESRLRIERDQPVEAMDADPEALLALARRLRYEGSDDAVRAALAADHARHRAAIRAVYERAFGERGLPSPEASG